MEAAVKKRINERYEVYRKLVYERFDPQALKMFRAYYVKYSDDTVEQIEEVVENE